MSKKMKAKRGREEFEDETLDFEGSGKQVPDEIQDLLGMIGQKLNKQYDSKKKKLENLAEKILTSSNELLNEHVQKYQVIFETKMTELKTGISEHQKDYDTNLEQLKSLSMHYQTFQKQIGTSQTQLKQATDTAAQNQKLKKGLMALLDF